MKTFIILCKSFLNFKPGREQYYLPQLLFLSRPLTRPQSNLIHISLAQGTQKRHSLESQKSFGNDIAELKTDW